MPSTTSSPRILLLAPRPVWEGPTIISAMATQTSRIRCGLMVAGNTYRNPGILAKIACTIDHISGGRMELGMGSGHTETRAPHVRHPLLHPGQAAADVRRVSRRSSAASCDNERTTFEGEYYHFKDALCEPKPVQQPFPLLVGGIGEQLSMRIVAESADIWNNWTSPNPEEYRQKLEAFLRHCGDVGRDPSDIRRSIHIKPLIGATEADIEERVETVRGFRSHGHAGPDGRRPAGLREAGRQRLRLHVRLPRRLRSLELLAKEVAPSRPCRGSGPAQPEHASLPRLKPRQFTRHFQVSEVVINRPIDNSYRLVSMTEIHSALRKGIW